jgi:glutathione S-transferase
VAVITPTNQSVLAFKGLHLYHSAISNCAMRVRMALEEKRLPWESHALDLKKGETHTPEYFGINPNGVVPTLVHDGVVIIESDDILEYLDDKFPDPPLRPPGPVQRAEVHYWLKLATGIHLPGVKPWIYYNRMRNALKMQGEALESYRRLQTNPELLAFHEKSASADGFSEQDINTSGQILRDAWERVEASLQRHEWIAGPEFSLADIAWVPLHFTLVGANFDFEPYPAVRAWESRLHQRDCFQQGILKWCPKF